MTFSVTHLPAYLAEPDEPAGPSDAALSHADECDRLRAEIRGQLARVDMDALVEAITRLAALQGALPGPYCAADVDTGLLRALAADDFRCRDADIETVEEGWL